MRSKNKKWPQYMLVAIFIFILFYLFDKVNRKPSRPYSHRPTQRREARRAPNITHGAPYRALNIQPDFAWPVCPPGGQVVKHYAYTLCYDERNEVARWVAYTLSRQQMLKNNKARRTEDFRPDPAVKTGSATLDDYKHSGYDRGHLAPAADMKWADKAMTESFLLSNMTPQDHKFNEGIWADLEAEVREWAYLENEIYVVTGPVLKGHMKKIGPNGVSVPPAFYKVILIAQPPLIRAIGFIIPNEPGRQSFWKYAVPVADVEQETGLDFFPQLPDDIENRVENTMAVNEWYTNPRQH